MSVRIIPARSGKGWEYDIRLCWPEGGRLRERGKAPLTSKSAAQRWAEARERVIASESTGCTPITLISGRTRLTYDAIPAISPPPPTATTS